MKKKWITRPYRDGDEGGILSLFSSNSSEQSFRTIEWWQWRHKKNPAGDAIISVAENKNEIIGHHCCVPVKVKFFSQSMIAMERGDALIKPGYRGQGIIGELVSRNQSNAQERGWSFAMGLPKRSSYPVSIKSGALGVCEMPKLIRVLKPRQISRVVENDKGKLVKIATNMISKTYQVRSFRRKKKVFENDLILTEEEVFGESYDDFWERISQHLKIAVIRSSDYLNWRYCHNPTRRYTVYAVRKNNRLLGFTVLGCYQEKYNIGRILEFLVLPDQLDAGEMLIEQANKLFAEKNMDMIQCIAQNPFLSKTLYRKYGYIKSPVRKMHFVVHPLASDLATYDLTAGKNWLISFGELGTM